MVYGENLPEIQSTLAKATLKEPYVFDFITFRDDSGIGMDELFFAKSKYNTGRNYPRYNNVGNFFVFLPMLS